MACNYEPQRHGTVMPRETERERDRRYRKILQISETGRDICFMYSDFV